MRMPKNGYLQESSPAKIVTRPKMPGYISGLHSQWTLKAFQTPFRCHNCLKSNGGRRRADGFHAVNRGSNPLGDAKGNQRLTRNRRAFFRIWGLNHAGFPWALSHKFHNTPTHKHGRREVFFPAFPLSFRFSPLPCRPPSCGRLTTFPCSPSFFRVCSKKKEQL